MIWRARKKIKNDAKRHPRESGDMIIIMKEIALLEKKIGVKFKKSELLRQALVHRSYLNEHPDFELEHNERLEFLGDAVLELAVTEFLYNKYDNPEG